MSSNLAKKLLVMAQSGWRAMFSSPRPAAGLKGQGGESGSGPKNHDYQNRFSGLYVRDGSRIVEASPELQRTARNYPRWPDKGPIMNGRRLTIMTTNDVFQVGETIHVIHVADVVESEREVFIMGPKPIYGEYLDGELVTDPLPKGSDPLEPGDYDGKTMSSPAVDHNYDITSYVFDEPGRHEILWQPGTLKSNSLIITVQAP